MYKTKLQELCHKRKWQLPNYENTKEGLDHIPSFQSKVTVNGLFFCSPSRSGSIKQAENDAAKLAYKHFTLQSAPLPTTPPGLFRFRAGEKAEEHQNQGRVRPAVPPSMAPVPPPEPTTKQLLRSVLNSQQVILDYLRHLDRKIDNRAGGDTGESEVIE